MSLDVYLFHLLNNLSSYWPGWGMIGIFAAEVVVWLLIAWYVGVTLYTKRNWLKELCWVGLGGAALYLTNVVISLLWFRPRPFVSLAVNLLIDKNPASKSFPSDHSSLAFFLAYLLVSHNRSWWWAYLIAAAVAVGRVVVGVHYPLDVLAGAVTGLTFGFFTTELNRIWQSSPARGRGPGRGD